MARKERGRDKVVFAPEPEMAAGQFAPNRVVSATLKPHEDVEWVWTSVSGGRYVSGYRIIKARRDAPLEVVV